MRKVLLPVVALICVSAMAVVIWRHTNPPTITVVVHGKQQEIPAMTVKEAGQFAGSDHLQSQVVYKEHLLGPYKALQCESLSTDPTRVSKELREALLPVLHADPNDKAAFERLPEGAFDNLCEELARRIFCPLNGMTLAEVERHVAGIQPHLPPLSPEELVGMSNDPSLEQIREKFREMYRVPQSKGYRIVRWALNAKGMRVALAHETPHEGPSILLKKWEKNVEDYNFFRFGPSEGLPVFYRTAHVPSDGMPQRCFYFKMAVIVEDSREDRFSLSLTMIYDPRLMRWGVDMVSRNVSLEAINQPRFVF